MDVNNVKINIDPDYARNTEALRKMVEQEKEETQLTHEKVSKIFTDALDEELATRQKQLEEIEDKIMKAQKLLHLVRYVLITSYYNKKNLENSSEEAITPGFDKQNRIHPALKKLLGNNNRLDIFNSRAKRKVAAKNCDISESSSSKQAKKVKIEPKENYSKKQTLDRNQNCLKSRKRTRHRLLVGNISKWIPSSDDKITHKWMVYIRGVKERPDVSHIVQKVVFFLHPSYKPHDVVEVRAPPFHLSRRGWGEFPLRVEIFFKSFRNKPVSIIHNLKLDKTCTGRQVLGNETIVDVYLHDDTLSPKSESDSNKNVELDTKDKENALSRAISKEEITNFELPLANLTSLETDYTPFESPTKESDSTFTQYNSVSTPSTSKRIQFGPVLQSSTLTSSATPSNSTISHSNSAAIQSRSTITHSSTSSAESHARTGSSVIDRSISATSQFCSDPSQCSSSSQSDYINSQPSSSFSYDLDSFEHDYCQDRDIIEQRAFASALGFNDELFLDRNQYEHSYSLPFGEGSRSNGNVKENRINDADNQNNKLIYGLDESYFDGPIEHNKVEDESATPVQSDYCNPEKSNKLLVINGNLIELVSPVSVMMKTNTSNEVFQRSSILNHASSDKFALQLPQNRFKNIGEALPFLLKRLPLWNKMAEDADYKKSYPFVAVSEQEFYSWNIGKRLSSEWSRSRLIRKIISLEKFPNVDKWNTKAYFMYARSHGYSPRVKFGTILSKDSREMRLIDTCFSGSLPHVKNCVEKSLMNDVDVNVDVESDDENSSSKNPLIDISDPSLQNQCTFIKEAALDCSVILKTEEIVEGVVMNAAERMIFEAVKCFAERTIRRAHHHMVCRKSDDLPEISPTDIRMALNDRSEFQSVKRFQIKKREIDFFS